LQLDLAAPKAFQPARQVVQVDVERRGAIPAAASYEICSIIAALGGNAGNRPLLQIGQESLAHGMTVNIDDHSSPR
jgi:hypothetical protein